MYIYAHIYIYAYIYIYVLCSRYLLSKVFPIKAESESHFSLMHDEKPSRSSHSAFFFLTKAAFTEA